MEWIGLIVYGYFAIAFVVYLFGGGSGTYRSGVNGRH